MNRQPPRTVIALMGPTACGKSALAMQLADQFNLSLVSVDSAMAYRGMDIGTAKPNAETLLKYPHELVDILDPEDDYSVGEFIVRADEAVERALEEGKTPFLVGGTMLYFMRFRDGIAKLPGRNSEIRTSLLRRAEEEGTDVLYQELQQIDPSSAERIHPNNYSRIERALEVYLVTGTPMSKLLETHSSTCASERLKCCYLELSISDVPRAQLHQRIQERVHVMIAQGLVDEVKNLMSRPKLSLEAMSMRAVGYRQLWKLLAGNPDASINPTTIEEITASTRQLARRQLTWLRNWQTKVEHVPIRSSDALDCITRVLQDKCVPAIAQN